MGPMITLLRRAGWRLGVGRFIAALVVLATGALAAALLVRLAEQLLALNVAWGRVLLYGPIAVVAGAMVYSVARRPGAGAVARRVDEGADLRESLSTALAVGHSSDPWAKAVVESAARRAASVDVRRAVPIAAPRWWPTPMVAALVLLVVWITVPEMDLLGNRAQATERRADERKVEQAKVESAAAVAKVAAALNRLDPQATAPEFQPPTALRATPEDIRRAAIKNLTSLKDRLEALKNDTKSQAAQQTIDKLKELRTPGAGPLRELARELGKGDFKQAGEALKQLAEKINTKALSPAEMERLKKQMESLAKQLSDLAGDQKALERRLAEAGLDPALAKNPEALKQALAAGAQASKQLTQAQKDALQKMAEALKQAGSSAQSLSQSMKQVADQIQSGAMSPQGQQGLAEVAGQMANMEAMAQDLASMQAGMAEANRQLGQMAQGLGADGAPGMGAAQNGLMATNAWSEGQSDSMGMGRGGPGRSGGGGSPGEANAPEKFEKRKFNAPNTGQGPIIGSTVVEGESVKGDAKAAFQQAVAAAEASASEALENNVVERQYQDVVKRYFSTLKAKAGTPTGATPAPAPAPSPTP